MKYALVVTLLSAYLVATAYAADSKTDLDSAPSLINFIPATREFQLLDRGRSVECFNWYLPTLNNGSIEYKTHYADCLLSAKARRAQIDQAVYGLRDEIVSSGQDTSSILESCASENDVIEYYGCLVSAAKQNLPLLNEISDMAADILTEVEEQHHLVEVEQNQCVIDAKRKYKKKCITIFDELQNCLSGEFTLPITNNLAINGTTM